jgi:hypothetical protein
MTIDNTRITTDKYTKNTAEKSDLFPAMTVMIATIMLLATIAILVAASKPLNTSPDQKYNAQKVAGILED